MTVAWLLVAFAVLLVPGRPGPGRTAGPALPDAQVRSPAGPRAGNPEPDETDDRRRSRTGLVLAVLALGGGCVALGGPIGGTVVAAVVCPTAVLGLRALQRRPAPLPVNRSVALALDLTAAALRAGRPLADALIAAAPAADPPVERALRRIAGLLRLGADPEQAWSVLARDGPLAPVAAAATRSAASGIRLAAAFERLAAEIRADASAAAAARAYRAGVTAMAPLAACFLPSFVCLGVVPVVIGIAHSALGVLP
ncbi:MAG: type II secretion system F family protein [Jatrophihabitans sp.]